MTTGRIVFLLEEESMKQTLRFVIPKIFPDWQEEVHWIPIAHRGKSDLEKSIPRKLRAWSEPNVRFVILRDNDGGDCRERKIRSSEALKRKGDPQGGRGCGHFRS